MAKKLVVGTLLVALIALLVAGAVNRTLAKTGQEAGTGGRHGAWTAQVDPASAATPAPGDGVQERDQLRLRSGEHVGPVAPGGPGDGTGLQEQARRQLRGGERSERSGPTAPAPGYGQGRAGQPGRGYGGSAGERPYNRQRALSTDHQPATLTGVVATVDATQLVVDTDAGQIVLADQPWRYALAAGLNVEAGDSVTLVGFYQDGTFEVVQIVTDDQTVRLREDFGRPLWAGRGRSSRP